MRLFLVGLSTAALLSGFISIGLPQPAEARRLMAGASMVSANRAFSQGNYQNAEKMYMSALKKNPGSLSARSGLAMVQAELFKLDAAEKNAQQVLDKDPSNPDALVALGKVKWYQTSSSDMTYRRQRDPLMQEAEQLFRKAIASNNSSPEAHNNLGRILQAQGKTQEAAAEYDKALNLDSRYEQALVYKGSLMMDQGQSKQALALMNEAIRYNSKSAKAHFYKGSALAETGDLHQALKSLNTALSLEPNAAHTLNKMAEIYQAQGNQAGSVSTFRKAILAKPEYTPAIMGLANLLDTRGDAELAISELRSAINIQPNYTPYHIRLGQLSLEVDKTEQALKAFNSAMEQDPSNAMAAQGLASTYVRLAEQQASKGALADDADLVEAENKIESALRYNPDDIGLHLAVMKLRKATDAPLNTAELERLAMQPAAGEVARIQQAEALLALGRFAEADVILSEVVARNANNPKKLYQLASTMKLQGDTAGSKKVFEAILAKQPNDQIAQRGLSQVQRLEGKAEAKLAQARSNNHWYSKKDRVSAKSFYIEALEQNPRLSDARLELAKLYEREDAYEKAALEYSAYLQLNPTMASDDQTKMQKKIANLRTKNQKNGSYIEKAKSVL
jgi:tetratricopeptide (TPR) repeat protein